MSSCATDTQRQFAISEGAKDVGARVVYADVAALEVGSAVSGLEPLAATRAAMSLRRGGRRIFWSGCHD
jgi:hypothetical protein